MKNDWIYKRDKLWYEPWEAIMSSMVKNIDDYLDEEENNNANNLYVSYIKDKYWWLRIEYSWWDEYTDNMFEIVEDLTQYMHT